MNNFWNGLRGKKTYVVSVFIILYAILGLSLHEMSAQVASGYIFSAFLAVGFRSALATVAEQLAMHIAEILADQIIGNKVATNDAVRALAHDVLDQAMGSLENTTTPVVPTQPIMHPYKPPVL